MGVIKNKAIDIMNRPLIINLFGGPGIGKSTCASYIFAKLKMMGIEVELVNEFAKDKTWEKNKVALANQFYIFGKQSFRLSRLEDQVDLIITDSPLIQNILYLPKDGSADNFKKAVVDLFNSYNNFNILLNRVTKYNPNGRNQTEEEARSIDEGTRDILNGELKGNYICALANEEGYKDILRQILNKLNQLDN